MADTSHSHTSGVTHMADKMTRAEETTLAEAASALPASFDPDAIVGLGDTEAGEAAVPVESIEDAFLPVLADVQQVTWDDGKHGYNVRMLCMLDPEYPTKLTEVYSSSNSIAGTINDMLEANVLGKALVKFSSQRTRAGYTVFKLVSPSQSEVAAFKSRLAAAGN